MLKKILIDKYYERIHEAKKKYSKEVFLKKYIRKTRLSNTIIPWIFAWNTLLALWLSIDQLFTYIDKGQSSNLLLLIFSIVLFVFSTMLTHLEFAYFICFMKAQIKQWESELKDLQMEEALLKANIKQIHDSDTKADIAEKILNDLPEWFGIPEYTKDYIGKSKDLPFFAAYDHDQAIGFIVLKATSQSTGDIYCMGVQKAHHRRGIGRKLYLALELFAKKQKLSFLQVKTVQEGTYDIYDKTNAFYKALGFLELECFPDLWDKHNPCQILVKHMD